MIIRPETVQSTAAWNFLGHKELRRPRVAVVLSGGGARGISQIGVLKALEHHRIPIDFIVATSLGAVVGGLYASGYTTAELESLAISTDWDDVLSLTEDTQRADLFVEQKKASDRSFLSLRFQGLEPVIPVAVSSGQRVTNFLSRLTLQAIHHPHMSFDDLKIPFRAVATDLISGERVIMKDGSLSEALRASTTVPLLFNPVERDSLRLLDGGLVSNIPVDIARSEGCDLIIAVNTTSGMRKEDELKAPWQAADQIMGIMMQAANKEQLSQANVVITPELGRHLSSDFTGIEALIQQGESSAEMMIEAILSTYDSTLATYEKNTNLVFGATTVERTREWPNGPSWETLWKDVRLTSISIADIKRHVRTMYSTGAIQDVYAEVYANENPVRIVYAVKAHPAIRSVRFSGNSIITEGELQSKCRNLFQAPWNFHDVFSDFEKIIRLYRTRGYSLARIESVTLDSADGSLNIELNEGVIRKIEMVGLGRTKDYVVFREFPLHEGEVFEIGKASEGVNNITGTTLFEYVHLEVIYPLQDPVVRIRLKERPSQLLSIGIRSDNERNLQGLLEIRDDNVAGSGSSAGLSLSGGNRNQEYGLDFTSYRLFDSYLTFDAGLFYRVLDSYQYADALVTDANRWERESVGEYRDRRFGGRVAFGAQLEKIGYTTVQFSLQHVEIENVQNASSQQQQYDLALVRLGTVLDSKNSYPFATEGVGLNFSYEFAIEQLGGEKSYNALAVSYEMFSTWGKRHTFHPRLTVGFADKTMPFGEQFRLGGRESMFGTREDDRRGRQLLLVNVEYRWKFPFQILFDTYLSVRYDLGSISEIPEQIKLSAFRHGVGAELALDTPVGPGSIGVGKSFYFLKVPPTHPIQQGPFLFYFMIGYQL